MSEEERRPKRNVMPFIMLALALIVAVIALQKGVARQGFTETGKLLLQVGPILIPAFVLAGMASVIINPESLGRWIGSEAGARGLLLGTVAGAVTPGGPFIAVPLLAVLLKGGASVGAVTAFLTSWALLGVHRVLGFEIPILGWRFVACRVVASLAVPVFVGWAAQIISGWMPEAA